MPKVNYNELKENIQDSIYITIEATGTNNYVASSSLITSLKSKRTRFTLFVANDSTGNCTLNLNSFGAKSIKDANGNIVTKLKQNIPYNLVYNGQDFILQGKGGGGNAQPGDVRQGKKFTNDNGEQVGTRTNLDIAKELGITATAAQILSGYKGLDKNGNIVDGIATIKSFLGGGYIFKGTVSESDTSKFHLIEEDSNITEIDISSFIPEEQRDTIHTVVGVFQSPRAFDGRKRLVLASSYDNIKLNDDDEGVSLFYNGNHNSRSNDGYVVSSTGCDINNIMVYEKAFGAGTVVKGDFIFIAIGG